MRQGLCSVLFRAIGPQAAQSGSGLRPDRRSSGGAESDKVGQALCLPCRKAGGHSLQGNRSQHRLFSLKLLFHHFNE